MLVQSILSFTLREQNLNLNKVALTLGESHRYPSAGVGEIEAGSNQRWTSSAFSPGTCVAQRLHDELTDLGDNAGQ